MVPSAARYEIPGFHRDGEHDCAGRCDRCGAAETLDIHAGKTRCIPPIRVSGSCIGHCDTSHTGRAVNAAQPAVSALIQLSPVITGADSGKEFWRNCHEQSLRPLAAPTCALESRCDAGRREQP